MAKRLPPLQWLRSFESAARHLSFTTAAEELGITQSAVSQQIKALEQFLGEPLFLRRPRSLLLTDAGRTYLPTVTDAFAVLAEGTSAFLGGRPEQAVEIKANTAFSVMWLAPRVDDFLARHPEVQLLLSTAMWEADYTGGYGSVEIRYRVVDAGGGTRGDLLASPKVFPVAAPEVAARLDAPADLEAETMLRIAGLAHDWEHWLRAAGHPEIRGRRSHSFNTYVLSLGLARAGKGVAIAHDILVADALADGTLVAPFADVAPVATPTGYYLTAPRRGELNTAARAFCDWLREQFA